jgi:hypothetical protein
MRFRALLATALPVVALGFATAATAPASAAGIPDGCTSEAFHPDFANDPNQNDVFHVHRVGDQMQIGVTIANDLPGACTIDDATITVQVPNADGTPGPITTIATHQSFPGGMAKTLLPVTAPYTVAFNPAVFRGPVTIAYAGTGHFPGGDAPAAGSLTSNVVVSKPHATLIVTPSTTSGPAPLGVTYTYTLKNDSAVDPGSPTTTPIIDSPAPQLNPDGSFLSDDLCGPIGYVSGDTHLTNPAELDPGETWTFTCPHLFSLGGTFTDHVSVAGLSSRDGRPWPVTVAQSTVTAMAPDMTVTSSHAQAFTQGDAGRSYTLTATNSGNVPTTADVSVADALPAGLSATAIAGDGWTCTLATLACTRSDALAAGAAYPPVTVTVAVTPNAPALVTNAATVSGGGELDLSNDRATDPTQISTPTPPANPTPTTTSAPTTTTTGSTTTTTTTTMATQTHTHTTPPSNHFAIRRVRITHHGTAVFTLAAPGPGTFTLTAKTGHSRVTARRAGSVLATLKPTAKARRALEHAHRLKVRVTIAFTPAGGTKATHTKTITLLDG